MAGPYDYTVNIPQPPAQNFLQSLLGIQQLKQMQQQSQLAEQQAAIQQQNAAFQQQMQPLEMQRLEAGIAASRASTAASNAAASGQGIQNKLTQLTLDQRNQVGSAISAFNKDPETGIIELAKVAPYMDANTRDGIARSIPFYVNNQIDKAIASGKEITPEQYQKFSNALTLLPTAEQQQARNAILSMPQNLQTAAKTGTIAITNAALNGNREAAIAASDEAAKALYNSTHPAAVATARLFDQLTKQLDDENVDLRRVPISALNLSALVQDKDFKNTLLDTLKENAVIQKGEAEKPMSRGLTNIVDASTTSSQSFANVAERAQSLLTELNSLGDISKGYLSRGEEAWKSFVGDQDAKSNYLTGFDSLVTSDLFKSLKENTRGSMNTQELKAVGGTVPGKYDSPKRQKEYLESIISAFNRKSQLESDRANFVSTFNTNGKAPKDAEVSGVPVKKGTTMNDFIAQRKKELGSIRVFGGANAPSPTAPPTPVAPAPAGANPLEAEMRKRGLIQ
jgi:hypothetical protein